MRSTLIISAAAAVLTFATAARADQWSAADAAYALREGNRAKIAEARAAYKQILDAATTEGDKLRAVSQLGRLAIYEGEMTLPDSDTAGRKTIFADCWQGFTNKIQPGTNGVGENPAYYYFKGVCLAYWGKAAGPLASLPQVPTLKALIAGGQTQDVRFEGGGIYRLMAGVYSNKAAIAVGLYRPDDALAAAKNAVAQGAYPGDPSGGADYYDNWRGLALTQDEKGLKDDAIATLNDKIAELQDLADNNALPQGREAEAKWNLQQMKDHLARLQSR
jgi:hypothetical protein